MGLQQFERRLERLVEGVFAKAFRSGLQPVELGRRLTREMDLHRTMGVRGTIVPNVFDVSLAAADHERFASFADTLVRELGDMVRQHARDEGYQFVGSVEINLEPDTTLTPGIFLVSSELREGTGGAPGALVEPDGARHELTAAETTIGRLGDCDIVLNDPNVSRRHAMVTRDSNGYLLADLGSTNGTRVNGRGVREHRLADGDEITIASTTLRFEAS